jgi:hypothetical protein
LRLAQRIKQTSPSRAPSWAAATYLVRAIQNRAFDYIDYLTLDDVKAVAALGYLGSLKTKDRHAEHASISTSSNPFPGDIAVKMLDKLGMTGERWLTGRSFLNTRD